MYKSISQKTKAFLVGKPLRESSANFRNLDVVDNPVESFDRTHPLFEKFRLGDVITTNIHKNTLNLGES